MRQRDYARSRIDRQTRIPLVRHDREQFRDALATLGRRDAKLGQVRMARAMLHQLSLLLRHLDPHETHGRATRGHPRSARQPAVRRLWWTFKTFDYLVTYWLLDWLNPGYLRRYEQRMKRELHRLLDVAECGGMT